MTYGPGRELVLEEVGTGRTTAQEDQEEIWEPDGKVGNMRSRDQEKNQRSIGQ